MNGAATAERKFQMSVGCYWFGIFVIAALALFIHWFLSVIVVLSGIAIFIVAVNSDSGSNNPPSEY